MNFKPIHWIAPVLLVALAAGGYAVWRSASEPDLGPGFASGNGRVEAVEVDVATKLPGRVEAIFVDEGDEVVRGEPLAQMETSALEAQLREAQAQLERAKINIETAEAQVRLREAERAAAQALLAQRQVEHQAAAKRLARSESLAKRDSISEQMLDDDRARALGAEAAVKAGEAQVEAASAGISAARAQVVGAQALVAATQATIERIQVELTDSELKAPRDGRVQYRIAEPGEVLGGGGRVLNLVDLGEVHMSFFLPTYAAGRVRLGDEVRIVLDALPDQVLPAKASFVADVAQFTPKTVETTEERLKLMFKVKAQIDPQLLQAHRRDVKTGVPGIAYVRIDPEAEWPGWLAITMHD